MRATLGEVLTDRAFDDMIAVATRFTEGVQSVLDSRRLPWTIAQLGARAEYRFCPEPPGPAASPRLPPTPDSTSTCTCT